MAIDVHIESSWKAQLSEEFTKPYFIPLVDFVKKAYQTKEVYPRAKDIFRAFQLCPFDQVRVVILGQDPYHGPQQADGLSFSVPDGRRIPPSLVNIFKEIENDIGTPLPKSGNLTRWAAQGVFLLNVSLTVNAREPASHQNRGWEIFTDAVIHTLSKKKKNLVFILWGAFAGQKKPLIDSAHHLILTSSHPSPFSVHRSFFGNKHFSKANNYLEAHGEKAIIW